MSREVSVMFRTIHERMWWSRREGNRRSTVVRTDNHALNDSLALEGHKRCVLLKVDQDTMYLHCSNLRRFHRHSMLDGDPIPHSTGLPVELRAPVSSNEERFLLAPRKSMMTHFTPGIEHARSRCLIQSVELEIMLQIDTTRQCSQWPGGVEGGSHPFRPLTQWTSANEIGTFKQIRCFR